MKNIKTLFLLAIMVLASITIAQSPARAQNQNGFTQADRELLIQNREEIKALRNEVKVQFEAVDKRFDAVDKRFDDNRFFMGLISTLFTLLIISVFGFAYWDRRAILKPLEARVIPLEAVIEKIKIEQESASALDILREWAKTSPHLTEIMKNKHLL